MGREVDGQRGLTGGSNKKNWVGFYYCWMGLGLGQGWFMVDWIWNLDWVYLFI